MALLTNRIFTFTVGRPAVRVLLSFIKALEADFGENNARFAVELKITRRRGEFWTMPKGSGHQETTKQ